jgi:phosphatidylglycerol lysyltransferase
VRLLGLLAGLGDWLFSSAALFALLPQPQLAGYPTFLAAYVAGTVVGAASGVPGGVGVFEAVVLTLSSVFGQVHESAAALLLYRCIYSLGPLSVFGVIAGIRRILASRLAQRRPR